MHSIENLKESYMKKKEDIELRLQDFRSVFNMPDRFIFKELCFCLLTPQSKARTCNRAIEKLYSNMLLFSGMEKEISENIRDIRFRNNKARYIILARDFFTDSKTREISIKKAIQKHEKDIPALRLWLVKNIKGLGMKEASHFLRNIGKGDDIAILDRHILKNLERYRIIDSIPKSITQKRYIKIENCVRKLSKDTGIPMDALDLLFWSEETGEIFK
ncbi:MAG: N-glycosylase/DNA lyase [Candidatus Aenigmarchaeota archaeon]|nr:N-glycosylase/DNA lyase [Candidatus Aenigmarchaeota archaeon]